jgi:hypothetical protein
VARIKLSKIPKPTAVNGRAGAKSLCSSLNVFRRPQEARYASVEKKNSNLVDCTTDRTLTHGYEATREPAMAAFAMYWRRELQSPTVKGRPALPCAREFAAG